MTEELTPDVVTNEAEEAPGKKKSNKVMIFSLIGVVAFALLVVAAIYFQNNPPGPKPDGFYAVKSEQYAAEIISAHNDLYSVNPEGYWSPGDKISGVERTFAAGELNKRIKTMRTNAKKLLELETEEGFTAPEEVVVFVQFILDEWVPFWERVETDIKECRTAEDAYALWDDLNDIIIDGELGVEMRAAFRGLATAGEELGWDEESYKARIK